MVHEIDVENRTETISLEERGCGIDRSKARDVEWMLLFYMKESCVSS